MELNQYQKEAYTFAAYDNKDYPLFALAEEVGEVMGKVAKRARGDEKYRNLATFKKEVSKELGDVLWQLCAVATEFGFNMDDIAKENLQKLTDRKQRNVIKSEGDSR